MLLELHGFGKKFTRGRKEEECKSTLVRPRTPGKHHRKGIQLLDREFTHACSKIPKISCQQFWILVTQSRSKWSISLYDILLPLVFSWAVSHWWNFYVSDSCQADKEARYLTIPLHLTFISIWGKLSLRVYALLCKSEFLDLGPIDILYQITLCRERLLFVLLDVLCYHPPDLDNQNFLKCILGEHSCTWLKTSGLREYLQTSRFTHSYPVMLFITADSAPNLERAVLNSQCNRY